MKNILVLAALTTFASITSCGSNGSPEARSAAAPDMTRSAIVGTVIDAATGEAVANVRVEGPRQKSTRSDARGRFVFDDLEIGTEGEVSASTDDGRKARIALRRLAPGRLEIVLQLTNR
ncbi:MAG: hypothetical protein SGI72_17170 [Planctomycetota bacterium]|nr:hypothetical protein [Planctomycetota bacterium]